MRTLILISCCFLSACCSYETKPNDPIISHEIHIKKIPEELLIIPPKVQKPNLNGTQKDIALWLIEKEKRTNLLENQLQKIKDFNGDN